MEIKWTDVAITDIENIRRYIQKDLIMYADRFIIKIVDTVEKLAVFPNIGRQVKESDREDLREVIFQDIVLLCKS